MKRHPMKKLPIGIQTFADIKTYNYCYIDKKRLIARLVNQGRFYFDEEYIYHLGFPNHEVRKSLSGMSPAWNGKKLIGRLE
jgi:hypothetical protein